MIKYREIYTYVEFKGHQTQNILNNILILQYTAFSACQSVSSKVVYTPILYLMDTTLWL